MMKFSQKQKAYFLSYNQDILTKICQTLTEYILRLNEVYQGPRILGRILPFENLKRTQQPTTLNKTYLTPDLEEDYEKGQLN